MQAGSIRGYLDLAGHQAEAIPQRLGYNQPPCLVYGRAHATRIPCVWQGLWAWARQLVPLTTTNSQFASSVMTWKYAWLPASWSE